MPEPLADCIEAKLRRHADVPVTKTERTRIEGTDAETQAAVVGCTMHANR